ncbi:MAG: hypothetical protein ABIX10_00960 [Acidimicrobiales bacterium]
MSDTNQNKYVQCIVDATDGVWIEAVSNDFLLGGAYISDRGEARLSELGFDPPDMSPNYSQHLPAPVDWPYVGLLFVTTRCDVYDVADTNQLTLSIYPPHTR